MVQILADTGARSNPDPEATFARDTTVMDTVRTSLATNNVILHYQPVVRSGDTTKAAFYEGLCRILDENGRIIPARDFMETVETRPEGRQIDCQSLKLALEKLRVNPAIRLSINMSARTIGHDTWSDTLDRGLHGNPTAAERLIIEITETSAMSENDKVADFMTAMTALGVAFALDDFGAGQTSFRYFKDFSFDIVKIDGGFITGIHRDRDSQVLTDALIRIARQFDMMTVAEFVETPQDAQYLVQAGTDCMQGYLFGAPSACPKLLAPVMWQNIA